MDNRNLFLAIVISVVILLGFEFFYPKPPVQQAAVTEQAASAGSAPTQASAPQASANQSQIPTVPGAVPSTPKIQAAMAAAAVVDNITTLLNDPARVSITTPSVTGSISLRGGRIDDLILNAYTETLDANSPKIRLLTPRGAQNAYYAEHGWIAPQGVAVPSTDTLWKADRTVLDPHTPVNLTWDNGQGLTFKRTISIDKDYMFTITQSVANATNTALTMNPYGLVSRWGTPETSGLYILHEGPLGVFEQTLEEVDYSDLQDDGQMSFPSVGGWVGFTDKYWLTALVPDQKAKINARMLYSKTGMIEKYQSDFVGEAMVVQPGGSAVSTTHFFAGAKKITVLDQYVDQYGIENFDLAIDFGIFYFLTKPIFYAMNWLYSYIGNFGVAILLLTVGIKAVLFPLANKSYTSMSRMKKLQPEVKKLQERFKDDKMRLNQEMMALYKREKANPAAGCLPILVQIPIFFALYKVLLVTIEMRQAPFFGWIQDLSVRDPASIWTLFGLIEWDHLAVIPMPLDIGVWPIIMGFTMWLQQRLNPQPTDPIQAKVFFYLPFIFTFLLASFSAGLVIYWAWNNTLSILQQWAIMKRMGVKAG
ncbi:MAG: membrane protein insertase YidC [Rhodospirillaceae bacterium]|nr:MAG: membrane protein insertase YidC [Rhodospirillaceae bacterium]